jgi:hypothetical protein
MWYEEKPKPKTKRLTIVSGNAQLEVDAKCEEFNRGDFVYVNKEGLVTKDNTGTLIGLVIDSPSIDKVKVQLSGI